MKRKGMLILWLSVFLSLCLGPWNQHALSQGGNKAQELDHRVKTFLRNHRGQWSDWNVPEADGKVLHDIILKNQYRRALEIGTSTGRSAIWMAWALSKTGGRLITIEIDEDRHQKALANFREAGLSPSIDARLADAHALVKELEGPFDFVFMDADKEWSKNYFLALDPKLVKGGCFAAHNVAHRHWSGIGEFLDYVEGLPDYETVINRASSEGISLSYKRAEN